MKLLTEARMGELILSEECFQKVGITNPLDISQVAELSLLQLPNILFSFLMTY